MSDQKQSTQTKSGRGGARPGAGRPKGRKSAVTIEIETAARAFANNALEALNFIAQKSKNDSARVAAATALLDRGFGKPRQALEHSGDGGGPIEIAITHEVVDPSGAGEG